MVIVTTDLIGLPREVSDEVAARVKKKHGLERRAAHAQFVAHAFRPRRLAESGGHVRRQRRATGSGSSSTATG